MSAADTCNMAWRVNGKQKIVNQPHGLPSLIEDIYRRYDIQASLNILQNLLVSMEDGDLEILR